MKYYIQNDGYIFLLLRWFKEGEILPWGQVLGKRHPPNAQLISHKIEKSHISISLGYLSEERVKCCREMDAAEISQFNIELDFKLKELRKGKYE